MVKRRVRPRTWHIWTKLQALGRLIRAYPSTIIAPLLITGIVMGLGLYGVQRVATSDANSAKTRASSLAYSAAAAFQQRVSVAIAPVLLLSAAVEFNPAYNAAHLLFNGLAPTLKAQMPRGSLRRLLLAPSGVIRDVYPLEGNEKAIGLDLLNDTVSGVPQKYSGIVAAVAARTITMNGPYRLLNGGIGIGVNNALFIKAPPDETWDLPDPVNPYCGEPCFFGRNSGLKYWGLVGTVIDVAALVSDAESSLTALVAAGYSYLLEAPNAPIDMRVVAASDLAPRNPVTAVVQLPNNQWILKVAPGGGWDPSWQGGFVAVVVVLAVALGLLVFALLVARRKHEILLKALLPKELIQDLSSANSVTALSAPIMRTDTPADLLLSMMADLLEGELPDLRDVVLIRTALLRGMDVYQPLDLRGQIKGAGLAADVMAALMRQLGATAHTSNGHSSGRPTFSHVSFPDQPSSNNGPGGGFGGCSGFTDDDARSDAGRYAGPSRMSSQYVGGGGGGSGATNFDTLAGALSYMLTTPPLPPAPLASPYPTTCTGTALGSVLGPAVAERLTAASRLSISLSSGPPAMAPLSTIEMAALDRADRGGGGGGGGGAFGGVTAISTGSAGGVMSGVASAPVDVSTVDVAEVSMAAAAVGAVTVTGGGGGGGSVTPGAVTPGGGSTVESPFLSGRRMTGAATTLTGNSGGCGRAASGVVLPLRDCGPRSSRLMDFGIGSGTGISNKLLDGGGGGGGGVGAASGLGLSLGLGGGGSEVYDMPLVSTTGVAVSGVVGGQNAPAVGGGGGGAHPALVAVGDRVVISCTGSRRVAVAAGLMRASSSDKHVRLPPRPQPPPPPVLEEVERLLAGADGWHFDTWRLAEVTGGRALSTLGFYLMRREGLLDRFQIRPHTLARLLLAVEAGYLDNPYHSAAHAADVLQTLHVIIHGAQLHTHYLDKLGLLAAYFAAIVHDHGHPGVTNDFLIATNDPLAVRYNDRAPLENHHVASSYALLLQPDLNITAGMSGEDRGAFRKQVIEMVMATDMKQHFSILSQFNTVHRLASYKPSDRRSGEGLVAGGGKAEFAQASHTAPTAPRPVDDTERMLTLQVALKVADIGHLGEELPVHCRWLGVLEEEFFQQGDKEKQLGIPISPLFDRSKQGVSKSQVGFYDFVALPLVHALSSAFTGTKPLMSCFASNYDHWKSVDSKQQQQQQQQAPSGKGGTADETARPVVSGGGAGGGGNSSHRRSGHGSAGPAPKPGQARQAAAMVSVGPIEI